MRDLLEGLFALIVGAVILVALPIVGGLVALPFYWLARLFGRDRPLYFGALPPE